MSVLIAVNGAPVLKLCVAKQLVKKLQATITLSQFR